MNRTKTKQTGNEQCMQIKSLSVNTVYQTLTNTTTVYCNILSVTLNYNSLLIFSEIAVK